MPKRLGKFELPNRLTKIEDTASDTFAVFQAEPFESGYGHTLGNSLRRVLLSSIEGAAISSINIDGVQHEFQSIEGVVEDVTDIVLNLKKVLFVSESRESTQLLIDVNREGAVTAAGHRVHRDRGREVIRQTFALCLGRCVQQPHQHEERHHGSDKVRIRDFPRTAVVTIAT